MITIDANNKTLGRVASAAAKALLGKGAADFAKNVVSPEEVKVTGVEGMRISGDKATQKEYIRYSGYAGGQKRETYESLMQRHPERVIEHAITRMLPKNKLGRQMLKKLKVYAGPEHPHQAQKAKPFEIVQISQ